MPSRLARFEATRWSLILRARAEDTLQRTVALEELCGVYWYPLYAFLRRSGRGVEDAQDLTQDFFARLVDGALLAGADPSKGKFRTLLLVALRNMDANAWQAARARKRGGGARVISMESPLAEERWLVDASPRMHPLWQPAQQRRLRAALRPLCAVAGRGEG